MRRLTNLTMLIGGKMSRREVVEIVCDRCKRTDIRPPEEVQEDPVLSVTFKGETVTYDDLCRRCDDTLGNMFKRMVKQGPDEINDEGNGESPKKGGIFNRGAS